MKNLIKLKVIILVFYFIFITQLKAADDILPVSKPSVDKETVTKTAKKKTIYPQKKPGKKEEKKQSDTVKQDPEKAESETVEVVIYPQKKTNNCKTKNRQSCC